jgi:glutamate synthase (NADPH/NADH) large chain
MSGGVAYVYDPDDEFAEKANTEMVTLSRTLEESDEAMLRRLVENHAEYTDSDRAAWMLDEWVRVREQFVKVMPDAYAEVIAERSRDDVRNDLPAEASSSAIDTDAESVATTGDD